MILLCQIINDNAAARLKIAVDNGITDNFVYDLILAFEFLSTHLALLLRLVIINLFAKFAKSVIVLIDPIGFYFGCKPGSTKLVLDP